MSSVVSQLVNSSAVEFPTLGNVSKSVEFPLHSTPAFLIGQKNHHFVPEGMAAWVRLNENGDSKDLLLVGEKDEPRLASEKYIPLNEKFNILGPMETGVAQVKYTPPAISGEETPVEAEVSYATFPNMNVLRAHKSKMYAVKDQSDLAHDRTLTLLRDGLVSAAYLEECMNVKDKVIPYNRFVLTSDLLEKEDTKATNTDEPVEKQADEKALEFWQTARLHVANVSLEDMAPADTSSSADRLLSVSARFFYPNLQKQGCSTDDKSHPDILNLLCATEKTTHTAASLLEKYFKGYSAKSFCSKGAASVELRPEDVRVHVPPTPSSLFSTTNIIIAASVAGGLGLLGAGYVFMKKRSNKSEPLVEDRV